MGSRAVAVYAGDQMGRYGFEDHPFSTDRIHAFWDEMHRRHLDYQVRILNPVAAEESHILRFHTPDYVERVKRISISGEGFLDEGDTPGYKGVFDDAAVVVGCVVDATRKMMNKTLRRCFVPIAGLHHSFPHTAAGFCVFNDVGVAIRLLEEEYGLERIAYVDIDAHHGDGLYYPFEDDPRVIFADIHEDGNYNYPRCGWDHEVGKGPAEGRKLNRSLKPLAGDQEFFAHWETVMDFLTQWEPQFIFVNCGADGLTGDPLAHLHFSTRPHRKVADDLCALAERFSEGRIIGVGGGGYELRNVGKAWATVVERFVEAPMAVKANGGSGSPL